MWTTILLYFSLPFSPMRRALHLSSPWFVPHRLPPSHSTVTSRTSSRQTAIHLLSPRNDTVDGQKMDRVKDDKRKATVNIYSVRTLHKGIESSVLEKWTVEGNRIQNFQLTWNKFNDDFFFFRNARWRRWRGGARICLIILYSFMSD